MLSLKEAYMVVKYFLYRMADGMLPRYGFLEALSHNRFGHHRRGVINRLLYMNQGVLWFPRILLFTFTHYK